MGHILQTPYYTIKFKSSYFLSVQTTTQTPRKRRRSMLKTSSTRLNEWERKDTKSGSSRHRIRCRAVIMSGHTIHSHENHIISFNHHTMRVLFLQQAHPPGHVMEMIIGYAQDVVPPTGGDSRYLTYIVRSSVLLVCGILTSFPRK